MRQISQFLPMKEAQQALSILLNRLNIWSWVIAATNGQKHWPWSRVLRRQKIAMCANNEGAMDILRSGEKTTIS